ncbi:hypothetical protein [Halegenticoccus soli]|nr:hypothetical protein [Halegenticoccus soli]
MKDTQKERAPAQKITYTEYVSGNEVIGFVVDVDNDRAWIQSTVTMAIDP